MLTLAAESRIARRLEESGRHHASAEDYRRRRAGETLKLRQEKRDEVLQAKRRKLNSNDPQETPEIVQLKMSALPTHLTDLYSEQPETVLSAVVSLREILTMNRPPIQECIDANIIPRLVKLLDVNDYPTIQAEACWCLLNISTGTSQQTMAVVEANAIPVLISHMSSPDSTLKGMVIWCLSNISGDSEEMRDLLLRHSIMTPLLSVLNAPNPTPAVLRDAAWLLSNLCRGSDVPWDMVSPCIPILTRLLYSADNEVLCDVCWTLAFLSAGDSAKGALLLEGGIGPQIVSLLKHPSPKVQAPAIRVVGNICFGEEEQTQSMINMGILNGLDFVAKSQDPGARKFALWTLSNITAGTHIQIHAFLTKDGLAELLMDYAEHSDYITARESLMTLCNCLNGGNFDQIKYLVTLGIIPILCQHLDFDDWKVLEVVLEATNSILNCATKAPTHDVPLKSYTDLFEIHGGFTKLEDLYSHQSEQISEMASTILKTYWLSNTYNQMEIANSISSSSSTTTQQPDGTYTWEA